MEINSLSRSVRASDIPMDKLVTDSQISEEEKVGEVSRQFEAVLLRQILQNAQKTHFGAKMCEDSATSGIYQDLVTTQLADGISKSGAFGLAQSLKEQLNRELPERAQALT